MVAHVLSRAFGGCLLGVRWGLGIGTVSPLVSFLITLSTGNPMPAAARLPFITAELAVFGSVSGLFSRKIAENVWTAFPATLLAAVAGRTSFILLVLVFRSVTTLSPELVWAQIQTGMTALVLQAVIVPIIVICVKKLTNKYCTAL